MILVLILAVTLALQSNYNNLFQGSLSQLPANPTVTKIDGTPLSTGVNYAPVNFKISSTGATSIRYTTNGETPQCSNALSSGKGLQIVGSSGNGTITAITPSEKILSSIGCNSSGSSPLKDVKFNFAVPIAPVLSTNQKSLSSTGATKIYYTLNGSTPRCPTSTIAAVGTLISGSSGTITFPTPIPNPLTIKSVACNNYGSSTITTNGPITPPALPTISLAAGTAAVPGPYYYPVSATISSPGSTNIFYTTDATPPACPTSSTAGNGTLINGPSSTINITKSTTDSSFIIAIGCNILGASQAANLGLYTFKIPENPTASPAAGSGTSPYSADVRVNLSSVGANKIYYTLDTTKPTCNSSNYVQGSTGQITIMKSNGNQHLNMIGCNNYGNTQVYAGGLYLFTTP